jgi:hypothetical protein
MKECQTQLKYNFNLIQYLINLCSYDSQRTEKKYVKNVVSPAR